MRKFKLTSLAVCVSLCLAVLLSVTGLAVNLTDIENHWAKEYIMALVDKGVFMRDTHLFPIQ